MKNRSKAPQKTPIICEHCGRMVHPGSDGGRVRISTMMSGEPERNAIVHTHCLNELIASIEEKRRPITPLTQFIPKTKDTPARRVK